jgi:hypothetical protein
MQPVLQTFHKGTPGLNKGPKEERGLSNFLAELDLGDEGSPLPASLTISHICISYLQYRTDSLNLSNLKLQTHMISVSEPLLS